MIEALIKFLNATKGKKGQASVSGALILLCALVWNLTEKVADVRERVVRIETKLGIPEKYVQR